MTRNLRAVGRLRKTGEGPVLPRTKQDAHKRTGKKTGFGRYLWGRHPITYGYKRPTFKEWLVATYPDLIGLAIFGALDWGIFEAPPPLTRNFPVTYEQSGDIVYPTFAYPVRSQFVPSWAASLAACGVPIATILLFNVIRVRSFWDANNGIFGVLYSLVLSTLFQVTVKTIVGGLRPHWLSVCQPDTSLAATHNESGLNGVGWNDVMYTSEICTNPDGDTIKNSLESFPSGHTTASFAGFVFLYLYLNAKLKVWSNYHSSIWKLGIVYAPILAATLIGGSLTVDQSHHWYDVLAGAVIGTVFAFSAYRTVYASVWDWRWNHVPLHRGKPFPYREDEEQELMDAVGTRKAGWGNSRCIARMGDPRNFGDDEGVERKYTSGGDGYVPECRRGVGGRETNNEFEEQRVYGAEDGGLRPPQETASGRPSSNITARGDEMV